MSTNTSLEVCFSGAALSGVDSHAGIIKGVIVAREGVAKGHGVYLDSEFIAEVARLGNEKEKGLKARFGHPNQQIDAIGTYIGRYKNFRVIEDKVYADLHLAKAAKAAPVGDLYTYVLEMALENPDMFGNSIVFNMGSPKIVEEYNEATGQVEEKVYVTITELTASDVVDTPAATESLFSAKNNSKLNFLKMEKSLQEKLITAIKGVFSSKEEEVEAPVAEVETTEEEIAVEVVAEESDEELTEQFKAEAEEAQVEATEEVVAEEVTVEEEASEEVEEVIEEAKEETFSAAEIDEVKLHAIDTLETSFAAERAELKSEIATFESKVADLEVVLSTLGAQFQESEAKVADLTAEIDSQNVTPTAVEGSADAQIIPEKKELNPNQKALLDFFKGINK